MKGLAEIQAENDAIIERVRENEKASIRRLKKRIARVLWRLEDHRYRVSAFQAIDEWHAAERRRR